MVVESLSHQHLGQLALLASALLDLGAFVLEPDLDLILIQVQFFSQVLPPFFSKVTIVLELPL